MSSHTSTARLSTIDPHQIGMSVFYACLTLPVLALLTLALALVGLSRLLTELASLLTLATPPNASNGHPVAQPLNGEWFTPATVFPSHRSYLIAPQDDYTFSTLAVNGEEYVAPVPSPIVEALKVALAPLHFTPIPQVEILPASETVVATAANPTVEGTKSAPIVKTRKPRKPAAPKAEKTVAPPVPEEKPAPIAPVATVEDRYNRVGRTYELAPNGAFRKVMRGATHRYIAV